MDDSTNISPRNGSNISTATGSRAGEQPLPNETMNRTAERTCTQKLTIPTLEKQDYTSANLWWRKFVQYIKMTKDLDLSTMTNSKEILPQYRDQLEAEKKDIFLWAIGQNAITQMTKTVREREPSSLPLHKLYSLFRLHFTPERNVHHSRADFLTDKPTKFKKMDCNKCGAPNWSRQHECPARGKKCAKSEKIGHNAKCCRTNKKPHTGTRNQ